MSIGDCSTPAEERDLALRMCDCLAEDIVAGKVDPEAVSIQLAHRGGFYDRARREWTFIGGKPEVVLELPEGRGVEEIADAVRKQLRDAVEEGKLEWFGVRNAADAGKRKVEGQRSPRFERLLSDATAGIGAGLIAMGATPADMTRIFSERKPEILEIMRQQRIDLEEAHGPTWL